MLSILESGNIASRRGVSTHETEERNMKRMAADVTETTFENEVIESSKETPVLVDFWAEWCGPCHAVSPVLEKIADERAGELKLVKVNIDENQELAGRYGIMSIPTMILFKDGEPAAAAIGARPKGDLERQLGLTEATV
jgi:thioredoxin